MDGMFMSYCIIRPAYIACSWPLWYIILMLLQWRVAGQSNPPCHGSIRSHTGLLSSWLGIVRITRDRMHYPVKMS